MKAQHTPPSSCQNIIASGFSRRKFLQIAGTTAVALPFIKPMSALATTFRPFCMMGCNGTNQDDPDPIQEYVTAGIPVTGNRHYCEKFTVPTTWPAPPTTTPPLSDDVSMCVTIYPNYTQLVGGAYDGDLAKFLSSTQTNGGPSNKDMLSLWHECSNLPSKEELARCPSVDKDIHGKVDGNCMQLTGILVTKMQQYLFNFVKTGNGNTKPTAAQLASPLYPVKVGAVDIGDWARVQPFMAPGLDFYGMDLYYGTSSLTQSPSAALNEWLDQVANPTTPYGGTDASISVCECNLNISDDDLQQLDPLRAAYFFEAAKWVWGQPNQSTRGFLCFWNGSGTLGGDFVTGNNGVATRASLAAIANQDWSNPNNYPEPVYS